MSERVKVNVKVSSEVNTILHDLFNQIQYEFCEQYEEEIERLKSIIKEAREYIQDRYDGEVLTHTFDKDNVKELLEILDKVEENK